jgi:hypothetical protein
LTRSGFANACSLAVIFLFAPKQGHGFPVQYWENGLCNQHRIAAMDQRVQATADYH